MKGFISILRDVRVSKRLIDDACRAVECLEPRRLLAGDGLSAVYFDNAAIGGAGQKDFTGTHVSRVESNLNINWGTGSPDPSIGADTFTARFAGKICAPITGTYTFGVTADDGERLWVNDQLITNRWSDSSGTTDTGTINLVGGKKYHIVLEHYEDTGNASINLQWKAPGDAALSTIPTANLYSMNRQYPASGSGIISVVGDYGAYGDGIHDDTTAIQNAINAAETTDRPIYFQSGTYRVTNTLTLGSDLNKNRYTIFQGQNRDTVVIKLDDNATGFGSSSSPKNLLSFYDGTTTGGDAFRNAIYDMTFDAGSGNAGARAVRFFANNQGGLENVTLKASSGSGLVGLDLTAPTTGPNLFESVLVDGFATGVDVGNYQYGADFSNLTLQNQSSVGLQNFANVVAIRNLQSRDSVTAIKSNDGSGLVNVLGSTFTGGASGNAAIVTNSPLLVQDSTQSGYGTFVQNTFNSLPSNTATSITDYVNTASRSLFGDTIKTLHLPVQDSPDAPWGDPSQWVAVDGSAADDTAAIQNAINTANSTGKTVLYFNPQQQYVISDTIIVSGGIRRLFGGEASFDVTSAFASSGKPMFKFQGLTGPDVTFDRFQLGYTAGNYIVAEQNTATPLVLSHFLNSQGVTYKNDVAGTVFFNDVSVEQVQFNSGLNVFARQFNSEDHNKTDILNSGANVWILGDKTETPYTVLQTTNNGQSELFGGLFAFNSTPSTTTPGISTTDSHVAASWAEGTNIASQIYTVEEQETRAGVTKTFSRGDSGTYYRGYGSTTALYVANGGTAYTAPSAPTGFTATPASTSALNLNWTDNSNNETGFKIERSVDQANWQPIALTAANVTTYSDVGLAAGTTYYYRIRSTNTAGDSSNATANAATQSAGPAELSRTGWTATATGVQWGSPSAGIDNNTGTDFGITQSAGNYYQLDMGTMNKVTQIVITTGANPDYIQYNYIRNYNLQISSDGTNWTSISTGQGSYSTTTINLGSGYTGRYLRMTVTAAAGDPWRINEFRVYGTAAPSTPAVLSTIGWTASATGVQWGSPSAGIDNNTSTDFGITQAAGNYYQVDMGTSHTITSLLLTTGTNPDYYQWNYIRNYNVQVSNDGTNWTSVATGQGSYGSTTIAPSAGAAGRYLRISVTSAASDPWRINELQVTGY